MKTEAIRQDRKKTARQNALGTRNRCNPCAVCQRSSTECPWLLEDRPVPGWEAEPSRLEDNKMPENRNSWRIRRCPLYLPPSKRRRRRENQ